MTFDGTSIPEGLDCGTLPSVAHGSSHTFELGLDESDRDAVPQSSSADPPKEELQVSHFTTAGELERAFTVFEASDTNLAARVSWKAPKSGPVDGVVRFFFVVRDMRGGSDFIERAVCIVPENDDPEPKIRKKQNGSRNTNVALSPISAQNGCSGSCSGFR